MSCDWLYFLCFLTNLPLYFLLGSLVFQRDKLMTEIIFLQDFILDNFDKDKIPSYFSRKNVNEKVKEDSLQEGNLSSEELVQKGELEQKKKEE